MLYRQNKPGTGMGKPMEWDPEVIAVYTNKLGIDFYMDFDDGPSSYESKPLQFETDFERQMKISNIQGIDFICMDFDDGPSSYESKPLQFETDFERQMKDFLEHLR